MQAIHWRIGAREEGSSSARLLANLTTWEVATLRNGSLQRVLRMKHNAETLYHKAHISVGGCKLSQSIIRALLWYHFSGAESCVIC
jgi:hypothetical protein